MKTCVLCFRRRNALQCTIRSLSRWKGVRILQARSASTLPWDSADPCANGERPASKRSTDRATLPETSLFTADTKLDIRLDATALTHSGIQELTYAGLIQLLKRILRNDFFFQVMGEELTLRIVSRKTESCLSEIICPEAEEIRMSGYVVRSQRRPG